MPSHFCSLKVDDPQSIRPNAYTLIKFPYGNAESYDPENMHALTAPDGKQHPYPKDPASGLIWPKHEQVATVCALIFWESDDNRPTDDRATEYRDRIVRDPLGEADSTCSEHRRASRGMQCFAKTWVMLVRPSVPLGLMVAHNAADSLKVTLAEFKIAYHTDPGS
jgi:hypothetical protein